MNLNATLFAQFIVFFIFVFFTMKFIWPPLIKSLDERAKKISDGLAAADRCKTELAAAEKLIQKKLTDASKESQKRLNDAEQHARLIIKEAKKIAFEKATDIIVNAQADIEQQTIKARENLRNEIAFIAIKCTEKILKREINITSHVDLLNQLKKDL